MGNLKLTWNNVWKRLIIPALHLLNEHMSTSAPYRSKNLGVSGDLTSRKTRLEKGPEPEYWRKTRKGICLFVFFNPQNILYNSLQLFATPWTVAYQTPLSKEFSRQEYWGGLPFQSCLQGIFPTWVSCIAHRFFAGWATGEALYISQQTAI